MAWWAYTGGLPAWVARRGRWRSPAWCSAGLPGRAGLVGDGRANCSGRGRGVGGWSGEVPLPPDLALLRCPVRCICLCATGLGFLLFLRCFLVFSGTAVGLAAVVWVAFAKCELYHRCPVFGRVRAAWPRPGGALDRWPVHPHEDVFNLLVHLRPSVLLRAIWAVPLGMNDLGAGATRKRAVGDYRDWWPMERTDGRWVLYARESRRGCVGHDVVRVAAPSVGRAPACRAGLRVRVVTAVGGPRVHRRGRSAVAWCDP
jgi:hypothetical protein